MGETIKLLVIWIKDFANTIRTGDVGMVSITVGLTLLGKLCTGLIPIVAIIAGVYQLQIFRTRLKTERIKYDDACRPDKTGKNIVEIEIV